MVLSGSQLSLLSFCLSTSSFYFHLYRLRLQLTSQLLPQYLSNSQNFPTVASSCLSESLMDGSLRPRNYKIIEDAREISKGASACLHAANVKRPLPNYRSLGVARVPWALFGVGVQSVLPSETIRSDLCWYWAYRRHHLPKNLLRHNCISLQRACKSTAYFLGSLYSQPRTRY